jgi:hypothetical protein
LLVSPTWSESACVVSGVNVTLADGLGVANVSTKCEDACGVPPENDGALVMIAPSNGWPSADVSGMVTVPLVF